MDSEANEILETAGQPQSTQYAYMSVGDIPNVIYKFGERQYLSRLVELGELRVCPLDYYTNPSMHSGLRHDRMEGSVHVQIEGVIHHDGKLDIWGSDRALDEPEQEMLNEMLQMIGYKPGMNLYMSKLTKREQLPDYWCWCTSLRCDESVKNSLPSCDCAVEVQEPFRFFEIVLEELARNYGIEYYGSLLGSCLYINNTYDIGKSRDNQCTAPYELRKHPRYTEQAEFRMLWRVKYNSQLSYPIEPVVITNIELADLCKIKKTWP